MRILATIFQYGPMGLDNLAIIFQNALERVPKGLKKGASSKTVTIVDENKLFSRRLQLKEEITLQVRLITYPCNHKRFLNISRDSPFGLVMFGKQI